MTEPVRSISGVTLASDGKLIARSIDDKGQRMEIDLTAIITDLAEQAAERKVQEHMKAFHGHQL